MTSMSEGERTRDGERTREVDEGGGGGGCRVWEVMTEVVRGREEDRSLPWLVDLCVLVCTNQIQTAVNKLFTHIQPVAAVIDYTMLAFLKAHTKVKYLRVHGWTV